MSCQRATGSANDRRPPPRQRAQQEQDQGRGGDDALHVVQRGGPRPADGGGDQADDQRRGRDGRQVDDGVDLLRPTVGVDPVQGRDGAEDDGADGRGRPTGAAAAGDADHHRQDGGDDHQRDQSADQTRPVEQREAHGGEELAGGEGDRLADQGDNPADGQPGDGRGPGGDVGPGQGQVRQPQDGTDRLDGDEQQDVDQGQPPPPPEGEHEDAGGDAGRGPGEGGQQRADRAGGVQAPGLGGVAAGTAGGLVGRVAGPERLVPEVGVDRPPEQQPGDGHAGVVQPRDGLGVGRVQGEEGGDQPRPGDGQLAEGEPRQHGRAGVAQERDDVVGGGGGDALLVVAAEAVGDPVGGERDRLVGAEGVGVGVLAPAGGPGGGEPAGHGQGAVVGDRAVVEPLEAAADGGPIADQREQDQRAGPEREVAPAGGLAGKLEFELVGGIDRRRRRFGRHGFGGVGRGHGSADDKRTGRPGPPGGTWRDSDDCRAGRSPDVNHRARRRGDLSVCLDGLSEIP